MIYLISTTAHPLREQRQVHRWCADNGILTAEVVEPVLVDPEEATITVQKMVPVEGQEDQDFPEMLVDEEFRPVTVRETVAMTVPPPAWMLRRAS